VSALAGRIPTFEPLLRRIRWSRSFRILVRILLWMALLVFAARTIATVLMERRMSSIVGSLSAKYGSMMPASLAPPLLPAAENRAPLFRAAGEALALDDKDQKLIGFVAHQQVEVTSVAESLRPLLDRNRIVFELLTEASGRKGANWEIDYKSGMDARLPDLLKVILLERMILCRSLLTLHEGHPKGAIAELEPGVALASSLSREPVHIVQLIRVAVDHMNHRAMHDILLQDRGLDRVDLSRLRDMLPPPAKRSGMRDAFLGEMKMGYKSSLDILDGRLPSDVKESFEIGNFDFQIGPIARWTGRPWLLWESGTFLDQYAGLVEDLEHPRFARTRYFTKDDVAPSGGKGIFFDLALPNLMESVRRSDLDEARVEIARAAFALELYARDHDGYPGSLQDLVPAYLGQVPVDPFTGSPIEYRREGNGFVVRSVADDPKFEVGLPGQDKLAAWRITR
jgi:hypothetical protein